MSECPTKPPTQVRLLVRGTARRLPLLLVALVGCGGKPEVQLPKPEGTPQIVKGKVILPGGQPLVGGTVCFVPVKEPGVEARGTTGADGGFELKTGDQTGAFPGDYLIRLEPPPPPIGVNKTPAPPFPRKYLGEIGSGLTATVKSGTNDLPPFRLDNATPPPRSRD